MSSNAKKTAYTEGIRVRSTAIIVCLALMLGLVSTGYGDIIIGNFENPDSNDGWGPTWDTTNTILTPACPNGVTLGSGSLRVQWTYKYWAILWAPPSMSDLPKSLTGWKLTFDLTAYPSDFPAGAWVCIGNGMAINSDNGWGPQPTATAVDRGSSVSTPQCSWVVGTDIVRKTGTVPLDYNMAGLSWFNLVISAQMSIPPDSNEHGTGVFYLDNVRLIPPTLSVKKCTVTAGKTQYADDNDFNDMQDTFTASGTISGFPADLNTISHIDVNLISADGNDIFFEANEFNYMRNVKGGKYTHSYKIPKGNPTQGAITSMTIDFKKSTFAVTIKSADLTGLNCPLQLVLSLDDFSLSGDVNEAIVNGPKTLIPTRLMRLYKDTLVVNKAKAKHNSKKASSDTLSVAGDIAVKDMDLDTNEPNLVTEDVVLTWGDMNGTPTKTLTIPGNASPALASFKASKTGHVYKCSKIHPAEDPNSLVAAQFDLDKCAFTVSVSKASDVFAGPADANFGVSFDTFSKTADVNHVTGRSW
jgi:hypothetical protein